MTTVALGYSDIAPGHIASVVTDLEMRSRPAPANSTLPAGFTLAPATQIGLDAYRALFRQVGADWLWYSRLFMADAELAGILADPAVEIQIVRRANENVGLLELDFRVPGECELSFLGLTPACTGQGLGRAA